jgi:hypothetical protein
MSNHRDALFIEEGEKDRRWLVGQMQEKSLTTEEKAMLNPLFGGDSVRDPRAVSWLHWFFLNDVNLDGFNCDESPPETIAKERMREESRSTWEDEVYEALYVRAPPFDKDLVLPTDITKSLLLGKSVSIAQAKHLLEKAGLRALDRRLSFTRTVYCHRNFDQWMAAKPSDIQAHLRSGQRFFTEVDDGSDLI